VKYTGVFFNSLYMSDLVMDQVDEEFRYAQDGKSLSGQRLSKGARLYRRQVVMHGNLPNDKLSRREQKRLQEGTTYTPLRQLAALQGGDMTYNAKRRRRRVVGGSKKAKKGKRVSAVCGVQAEAGQRHAGGAAAVRGVHAGPRPTGQEGYGAALVDNPKETLILHSSKC
jgi:hypothetical protein